MIDTDRFSISSLWRQLLCNFEADDLEDSMDIIAAIRTHPRFTPRHASWFRDLLANLLCDSLKNASFDWALSMLDEGAEVMPEAAGHAVCRGFSDDEKLRILTAFVANRWSVNSADEENTPIFNHITYSEQLVSWFLSHGADPNVADSLGHQPVDTAARGASFATIQQLLRAGARLSRGNTALHHAVRRRSHDSITIPIMVLLIDHSGPDSSLDDIESTQEDCQPQQHSPQTQKHDRHQQQRGESPNSSAAAPSDRPLGTLLHSAVRSGSAARVQLLLERGADPRKQDTAGQTPLDLAQRYNLIDTEKLILEWLGRRAAEEERRGSIADMWELVDDFGVLEIAQHNVDPSSSTPPTDAYDDCQWQVLRDSPIR